MRANPNRIGEVCHELCPVRRLLLPPVPHEQGCPDPNAQNSKPHLRPLRHKPHQQNTSCARHDQPSVNHVVSLDVTSARRVTASFTRTTCGEVKWYFKSPIIRRAEVTHRQLGMFFRTAVYSTV